MKPLLDIFSNPFTISVENAPESMQLEIIDIQNDQDLRNKFNEGDLLNFYRCIDKNMYEELRINALKCASLFGSTYICEQTFSILNNKIKIETALQMKVWKQFYVLLQVNLSQI